MWTGIIAAIVGGGGLTAVGITVDRPALVSEMQQVAEQSVENQIAILIIQRADIQKRIWHLEDRIIESGITDDRKQRLWELRTEYERLEEEIADLLYTGDGL
jgi:hypothetical protein